MLLAYIFGRASGKVQSLVWFFRVYAGCRPAPGSIATGVPEHTVLLYSRRTCHLCDEARAALLAAHGRRPFAFQEVFVDDDEDLERQFGLRVPVVLVDGAEEFEFQVDPDRLRRLLSR
jgi:hypothetical protein